MTSEQTVFLDRAENAFRVFESRNPEYVHFHSEATASLMAEELFAAGLSADNADHLAAVWQKLKPKAATSVTESADDEITAEAKRLISEGQVSRESIAAMSTVQYQRACTSSVFNKVLELLEPPREKTPLTVGELQAAVAETRLRQSQGETVIVADVVRAVEQSKREHWTSIYQEPPPMPRATEPSRGVVNLHASMHIAKPRTARDETNSLAQERKDHAFIDESQNKIERARRVRANRGK